MATFRCFPSLVARLQPIFSRLRDSPHKIRDRNEPNDSPKTSIQRGC